MRTNLAARNSSRTYEGAPAAIRQKPEVELLRAVGSCLLFENTFYESGIRIAERIADLAQRVPPDFLAELALYTRSELNLRHVSLWLAVQLCRTTYPGKPAVIAEVIQRADELAEILALYWRQNPEMRNTKHAPVAAALKRGIALAFPKFNEYQLAKWNQGKEVKLRDALFLSHAKPKDKTQERLWKKLIEGELATPDTWEVALSGGADKKATFERLLRDRKIGYLALLRNLRNMDEAGVERELVIDALVNGAPLSRALPFQFVAAYRFAPAFAAAIDTAMLQALVGCDGLGGSTALVIDVSGSMDMPLSDKSQLNRIDAAAALAVLTREVCTDVRIFTFSDNVVEVPAARGLGLVEAIHRSQAHSGTYLGAAVNFIATKTPKSRLIVLTDEQSHDGIPALLGDQSHYLINVASYEPALPLAEGGWTRINGFSERLIEFIRWNEEIQTNQPAHLPKMRKAHTRQSPR